MSSDVSRRASEPASNQGAWLLAILVGAFAIRAVHLGSTSIFEAESFSVLMGRSVLRHATDIEGYLPRSYGWYLWPVAAAWANRLGGLTGLRLLAALLGTGTVLATFYLTRRLFDEGVGRVAAVFASVFPPAVMALLMLTLAAFARAWRRQARPDWLVAALCAVVFLSVKHSLAAVGLLLCVLAPLLDRRNGWTFTACVMITATGYVLAYRDVLGDMLQAIAAAGAAATPASTLVSRILRDHLAPAVIALLSLTTLVRGRSMTRRIVSMLLLGAIALALFPSTPWYDPEAWSHAAYPVLVLLPAAAFSASALAQWVMRGERMLSAAAVLLMAAGLFLLDGHGLTPSRRGFVLQWPNVNMVTEFLHERIQQGQRVLVDDRALRYPLDANTTQELVTDELLLGHVSGRNDEFYARAIRDGRFDYIVFDGNSTDAARALHDIAEQSIGTRYVERFRALQSTTGLDVVVFERISPPVTQPPNAPKIVVTSPTSGASVITQGNPPYTTLTGAVSRAPANARLRVEVYTDQWYAQGEPTAPAAKDGRFAIPIVLGGAGLQRCPHLVRVRLMSADQRILDEVVLTGVQRASIDSAQIPCPAAATP